MKIPRTIFLYGGGDQVGIIDDSIAAQISLRVNRRHIAFVPSAKQDQEKRTIEADRFTSSWSKYGFRISILDVITASKEEIFEVLEKTDCLYFGGGDTFFLAGLLQKKGMKSILLSALKQKDIILAGYSAGAVVLGETTIGALAVDPQPPGVFGDVGLGLVPFNLLVHFDPTNARHKETLLRLQEEGLYPIVCLPDNVGVEIKGEMVRILSTGPKADVFLSSSRHETYGNNERWYVS